LRTKGFPFRPKGLKRVTTVPGGDKEVKVKKSLKTEVFKQLPDEKRKMRSSLQDLWDNQPGYRTSLLPSRAQGIEAEIPEQSAKALCEELERIARSPRSGDAPNIPLNPIFT
jgi:hypothetical protein